MTECQHKHCSRDAVGTIEWDTGSTLDYCQAHIRETRADYPELVESVTLT